MFCLAAVGNGAVASGSGDKSVRLWDLEMGMVDHVLEGHADGPFVRWERRRQTPPPHTFTSGGCQPMPLPQRWMRMIIFNDRGPERLPSSPNPPLSPLHPPPAVGVTALAALPGSRLVSGSMDGALMARREDISNIELPHHGCNFAHARSPQHC